MTDSLDGHPQRPVVLPVEVRVDHDRLRHERRAVGRRCGPSGRGLEVSERPPRPTAPRPRPPWRTGRSAAWPGCSAGRWPDPRRRGRGSRSAGPGRCRAGRRASRTRSSRRRSTRSSVPSSSNRHSSTALGRLAEHAEVRPHAVVGGAEGDGRPGHCRRALIGAPGRYTLRPASLQCGLPGPAAMDQALDPASPRAAHATLRGSGRPAPRRPARARRLATARPGRDRWRSDQAVGSDDAFHHVRQDRDPGPAADPDRDRRTTGAGEKGAVGADEAGRAAEAGARRPSPRRPAEDPGGQGEADGDGRLHRTDHRNGVRQSLAGAWSRARATGWRRPGQLRPRRPRRCQLGAPESALSGRTSAGGAGSVIRCSVTPAAYGSGHGRPHLRTGL